MDCAVCDVGLCDGGGLAVEVIGLLCCETCALVASGYIAAGPDGAEYAVPEGEEWLGEVGFDSPTLVMYVVVAGIVRSDVLQRVPRQSVTAMVIDRFDG